MSPVYNRVFYVDDACGVLDHHLPVSGVVAARRREVHSFQFPLFVLIFVPRIFVPAKPTHELFNADVPYEGVVVTYLEVL